MPGHWKTSRKGNIASSTNYRIAETHTFQKKIASRAYHQYYPRIRNNVYPVVRDNPFFGANIKQLKGEFSSIYRYRLGGFRLFYSIDTENKLVFILDIVRRKDAYR